jgi:osmoprotectant transport system ATP-binding protein
VTHDVADALLRADLLLVLDGGRIVAAGPPALVAADPHPAARALIDQPLAQARALASLGARPA